MSTQEHATEHATVAEITLGSQGVGTERTAAIIGISGLCLCVAGCGVRDDAAFDVIEFQQKHGGVKARPGVEWAGDLVVYPPIGQIAVELQEADRRQGLAVHRCLPAHVADESPAVKTDGSSTG